MTQIGRNDPCPCGSGKKYKKCCYNKQAEPSKALYYQRLSDAHNRLVSRLLPFATRVFGEEAVGAAMYEFCCWPEKDDTFNQDALERVNPIFWPWFLFNWTYEASELALELSGPEGRTVAEVYAEKYAGRLDPLERNLIENINRRPYSFYEVIKVDKGRGMELQDVLKGDRTEVQERSGSEFVQPGDLLFGRAVSVDGVGMLMGLAPTIIPPGRKPDIIQFRKKLRRKSSNLTDETLYEWDIELRELYFLLDHVLNSPPQICNTDGDPLEFHRLIYEISSAEEALEKLCGLCVTMTPQEIRQEAKQDASGHILSVEFPWDRLGHAMNQELPNTILGHIEIKGRRLTAEVNSKQRADVFRHEVDQRLGDLAHFKVDEIQDLASMMNRPETKRISKEKDDEQNELMRDPDVREQLSEFLARHWENWINEKIPALGGKTPKQAVKSADGREAVEALLKDAERARSQDAFTNEANRKGVSRVRELLGLKV